MKRKQLREQYQVSAATFAEWLQRCGITHTRRKLTPAEVRRIKTHLGEPDTAFLGNSGPK